MKFIKGSLTLKAKKNNSTTNNIANHCQSEKQVKAKCLKAKLQMFPQFLKIEL